MVQYRATVTMADRYKVAYMIYRSAPFSVILNDPWPRF